MLLAQVVKEIGMPFKPTNNRTMGELDEALADVKTNCVTTFTNVDDLFTHIHQSEDTSDD